MHIAVVANCQARPVASLVKVLSSTIELASTVVVHLSTKDGAEDDHRVLDQADFIFAQFVTDEYPAAHLATSRLKQRYGQKVISWPNIFFRGQQPDLAYARSKRDGKNSNNRLVGPLREYHFKSIYRAWQNGQSIGEFLRSMEANTDKASEEILNMANSSLEELRRRESKLDTHISDIVDAEWKRRRLFFTFNHPSLYLLLAMSMRLLEKAQIDFASSSSLQAEPLALVIPPILPWEFDILGKAFDQGEVYRGAELAFDGDGVRCGSTCNYTLEQILELSFRAYDVLLEKNDQVLFSPP